MLAACRDHDVEFPIAFRHTKTVVEAIDGIADDAWVRLHDLPAAWSRRVAKATYKDMRLIVRRVKHENDQARLFDVWRHNAFVTDRTGDPIVLNVHHRVHAVQEQVIRELKNGTGLARCPSGKFDANGAWPPARHAGPQQPGSLDHYARAAHPRTHHRQDTARPNVMSARSAGDLRPTTHPAATHTMAVAEQFTHALDRLRAVPIAA